MSIASEIKGMAVTTLCPTTTAIRFAEALEVEPQQDFDKGVTSFEFDDGSILIISEGELAVNNDNYHG